MKIIRKPGQMTKIGRKERSNDKTIGFVPTLGFLHEGHEALIKRACKDCDVIVVSRFVNPTQFRKKAYEAYPANEKRDADICKRLKVDYLFSPSSTDMYPEGYDTTVEVKDLANKLEGSRLRWHYKAVTTVVTKLFNIVLPDHAYFGKKDAHQLAILKRMVVDLNIPVKIVGVPTRRAKDGVALSSRNSLLNEDEQNALKALPKAIKEIAALIRDGVTNRKRLAKRLVSIIEKEPLTRVDFASVVDADTLSPEIRGKQTLIYVAVYIGDKRVTDNMVVKSC